MEKKQTAFSRFASWKTPLTAKKKKAKTLWSRDQRGRKEPGKKTRGRPKEVAVGTDH